MSTGLECLHFEPEPGKWYYLLEDWNSPKGAWDWRDFSTCYGPFDSLDASLEHRISNHANPGGYSTSPYDGNPPGEVIAKLVAEAVSPSQSYGYGF